MKNRVRGGNGDIIFSEDNMTATKVLRNTSSKEKIARFKREVEVMKSLSVKNIPNIVEVISVELNELHPEHSKIIMKKYDGCLSDLIDKTRGNVKYTLELILPIIKALKKLSENSPAIYHRDLKPENILYKYMENRYELFLTDFGICFLKDDECRLTEEITAVGARMFLAPEYEVGRVENVSEKGDIFSIGKIIWWLINGAMKALLPSNFWFVDDFDLTKKFPNEPYIFSVNVIIASCLRINPNERCDYDQLIAMINNVLSENIIKVDEEKRCRIEIAIEKRKIQYAEKLKQNRLLVNEFSFIFLSSLKLIIEKYPFIDFLNVIRMEYVSKSKDGIDFSNSNVDNDSAHYLYSKSFDDIYISINYNPSSKGELYANITFDYSIRSSGIHESMKIKYNENCSIVTLYQSVLTELSVEIMMLYLENMILNYVV